MGRIVAESYERVPYYRQLMQSLDLSPKDIRRREDLDKLPILTKEQVRAAGRGLMADGVSPRQLQHRHTSGTTGKALHFYVSPEANELQWAVWWRLRNRFGLKFGDLHANFSGQRLIPPGTIRPPDRRWNKPLNQALIGMREIRPECIEAIVKFLDEQPFVFWSGYPSFVYSLIQQATEQGLALSNPPRAITLGAENTYEYQRAAMEAFTGAVVTDHYGFAECCGNASKCEEGVYHEDFEFGVMECVDPEPLPDGGVRGKIVCTGFGTLSTHSSATKWGT